MPSGTDESCHIMESRGNLIIVDFCLDVSLLVCQQLVISAALAAANVTLSRRLVKLQVRQALHQTTPTAS